MAWPAEGMFFTADNLAELEAHLANNPEVCRAA
jgi:hypothetical protein